MVMNKFVIAAMIIVISSLLMFYQNCQYSSKTQGASLNLSPEFTTYLDLFIKSSNKYNLPMSYKNLKMTFVDQVLQNPNFAAYCYKEPWFNAGGEWIGLMPVIVVKKSYWNSISSVKKKDMIFHEMGHCFLNRTHTGSLKSNDVLAIMNQNPVTNWNTNAPVPAEINPQLSIMNSVLLTSYLSDSEYNRVSEYLERELFTGASLPTEASKLQDQNLHKSQPSGFDSVGLDSVFYQTENGDCSETSKSLFFQN
jgi:hypothetical protein